MPQDDLKQIMSKRVDPLNILKSLRKEPINSTSSITDTQYCPVCNIKMPIKLCNGIPAYVCVKHRIALPVKDSIDSNETTE